MSTPDTNPNIINMRTSRYSIASEDGLNRIDLVEKHKLDQALDMLQHLADVLEKSPVIHTRLRTPQGGYGHEIVTVAANLDVMEIERVRALLIRLREQP